MSRTELQETARREGRHLCTQEDPWTPEKGRAIHPDAESAGEDIDYGGGENCAQYRCPWCGHYWEEELPQ